MGELSAVGQGVQAGFGMTGFLLAGLALALYAFFGADRENDDDDSTPGGGLMQPVA